MSKYDSTSTRVTCTCTSSCSEVDTGTRSVCAQHAGPPSSASASSAQKRSVGQRVYSEASSCQQARVRHTCRNARRGVHTRGRKEDEQRL